MEWPECLWSTVHKSQQARINIPSAEDRQLVSFHSLEEAPGVTPCAERRKAPQPAEIVRSRPAWGDK